MIVAKADNITSAQAVKKYSPEHLLVLKEEH